MKKIIFLVLISLQSIAMDTMVRRKSVQYPTRETDAEMKQLLKNQISRHLKVLLEEHPNDDWEERADTAYLHLVDLIENGHMLLPTNWCVHIDVRDEQVFLPALAVKKSCSSLFQALFSLFSSDYSFDPTLKDGGDKTLTDIVMEKSRTGISARIVLIYGILDRYCKEYRVQHPD